MGCKMKKEDFKFIYQFDGYYLVLYKNRPLYYIDYDNFDFADMDKLSEVEINNKILDIIISEVKTSDEFKEWMKDE